MNKVFIFLLVLMISLNLNAQNNEVQITKVFKKLVNAYGNAKTAPQLEIKKEKQSSPAVYLSYPNPKIILDNHFYELCKELGKDSLNALSIVLSHELAHYYNDHTFCSDFAFALNRENKEFSRKLKDYSKSQIILMETEADNKAIYYSAIAGYNPFTVYEQLLDRIYQDYALPDKIENYPSKQERKAIYRQTSQNASKLYDDFQKGLVQLKENNYDEAIDLFEKLNRFFPSRENYNNLGMAKTFKVLAMKPLSRNEYLEPEKFAYPLEIDSISYLEKSRERSSINTSLDEMEDLLKSAQKDFEKAISLDPAYVKAYINLACVFDLLGNPEAAIGKLKELNTEQQKLPEVKKIMAIAYYHSGNLNKAEELWGEL